MSCYEWEQGNIVIPKAQYSKFFKDFLKGYNEIRERELALLKQLQKEVITIGKGKRNFNFHNAAENIMYDSNKYTPETVWKLFYNMEDKTKKPKVPIRKLVAFANTQTKYFEVTDSEASIGFDRKTHTVTWSVPENNHACESAHEAPEAHLFFGLLNRVIWTKNSGGEIVGNDEYNQDSTYCGGGGNYNKSSFGI